jgi:hypothetical protein
LSRARARYPVALNLSGDVFSSNGHVKVTHDDGPCEVSNITAYVVHEPDATSMHKVWVQPLFICTAWTSRVQETP